MPSPVATAAAAVEEQAPEPCSEGSGDERGGAAGDAKRQRRSVVKCAECGEREAKYRCPGCGLRSCGLPCVKSHKERTKCTGKRDRTAFVPLNNYDDNVLISDYNLLEETLRQTDAAKRLRTPLESGGGRVGGRNGKTEILHPSLRALQRQAQSRSTSLFFFAHGMSKRKANTSFFEKRTKRIFWRVEWTFEGTDVRLIDPKVDENLSLEAVLAKHFTGNDVMVKHRLRNFIRRPLNDLKLLFLKEPCLAAGKTFHELNVKERLRDELVNKSVFEYPVINVILSEDAGKYTVIAPDLKPPLPEAPISERHVEGPSTPSPTTLHEPEGVPFREEEIEEGEFVP